MKARSLQVIVLSIAILSLSGSLAAETKPGSAPTRWAKIVDVTGREAVSYALTEGGTLWGMGPNHYGQLGYGKATDFPVHIMDGVRAVNARSQMSVFLKNDGTLWRLGLDQDLNSSIETREINENPIQVMSEVKSISADYGKPNALKTDEILWSFSSALSRET